MVGNRKKKPEAVHRRSGNLKQFKKPIHLRFERENIIAVIESWFEWLRYRDKEYRKGLLKKCGGVFLSQRSRFDAIKKALKEESEIVSSGHVDFGIESEFGWRHMSEDMFDACVAEMHEHGDLTVRDDSRILKSIDGYLYHSMMCWLRRDYNDNLLHGERREHEFSPSYLEGCYKVYSPSADQPGKVLVGKLQVTYTMLPQKVETRFEQKIANGTLIRLSGTFIRLDQVHCLWMDNTDEDMPQEGIRFNRLKITQTRGKYHEPYRLCGWSQVFGVTRIDGYYRKMLIQRAAEEFQSAVIAIDDPSIPEEFRAHLTSENIFLAPEFEESFAEHSH